MLANEMLPRRFQSVGAGGRQREVLEMKRTRFSTLGDARLEGLPEPVDRKPPAAAAGLLIELRGRLGT